MISLEESKRIQYEILCEIHDFCIKNGLKYYLFYGTLLGAVRHNGFIPWDDDIDIVMPREDYEIFMKSFRHNYYVPICCTNNDKYYLPFGKVYDSRTYLQEHIKNSIPIGVYVDIFPLDNASNDFNKNRTIAKKIKTKRNVLTINVLPGSKKRSFLKRTIHSFLSFLNIGKDANGISKRINSLAMSFRKEKTTKCFAFSDLDSNSLKFIYDKKMFEPSLSLKFEKTYFNVPNRYDNILTMIYGDYMSFPPIDKQVSHHEYDAFVKK